ncbi:MAG: hypothetical protein EAZ27_09565, partial [Cytophagales bacterium]
MKKFLLSLSFLFSICVTNAQNNALDFDGIDDYVRISNPFTAFDKEITVESWIEFNSSSSI